MDHRQQPEEQHPRLEEGTSLVTLVREVNHRNGKLDCGLQESQREHNVNEVKSVFLFLQKTDSPRSPTSPISSAIDVRYQEC